MSALWLHQIYYMMGFLLVVLLILVASCAEVYVVMCYLQLCAEDHRWWWTSIMNGGATGAFIFAYSFYYYLHRSNMSGALQLSFYFGYTGIVAYAFFLMLGFVGFISAFSFVDYIYRAVKAE